MPSNPFPNNPPTNLPRSPELMRPGDTGLLVGDVQERLIGVAGTPEFKEISKLVQERN